MKIPIKVNPREKKVLLIGGIIVLALVLYQLFFWYRGFNASIKEYSDTSLVKFEKQLSRISQKESLQKKLGDTALRLKELEGNLLPGDTPPVAAAELQRFLKDTAVSLTIEIKSERTLSPIDMGSYMGIPVEIGFISSTAKLKSILYKIRTSPFLLTVSEMNVRVINIANPVDAYTTVVVKGFIKQSSAVLPPAAGGRAKKQTALREAGSVS